MNASVKKAGLISAVISSGAGLLAGNSRPNIVLVLADDLGTGWSSPHAARLTTNNIEPEVFEWYQQKRGGGSPISMEAHLEAARTCMPFLSSISSNAAVFDRCFATCNVCSPSRAGLLTGTFQQRWGAYQIKDVDLLGIPAGRATLPEQLKAAGYRTGLVGKWHVAQKDEALTDVQGYATSAVAGQHPLDRGFDYYFGYNAPALTYYNAAGLWNGRTLLPQRPAGEFLTELLNSNACEFLDSSLAGSNQPVFLYYAPMTIHGPLPYPPAQYTNQFHTGVVFSDGFAGHLLALDKGIEQIFQILENRGQLTNTVFIFSADNGCASYNVPPQNAPNRGGKGNGWLGGSNVPLIIWKPGLVVPGVNTELASQIDIMPTLLDIADITIPSGIDGQSFLPFLRGESPSGPRNFLCAAGIHASHWSYFYEASGESNNGDAPTCPLYTWMIRSDDTMLIRITETSAALYTNLPAGIPARTLLYDLSTDRHQRNDLSSQYPKLVQEFDQGIHQWLSGMQTPLSSQQADYAWLLDATKGPGGFLFALLSFAPPVQTFVFRQDLQSSTVIGDYSTTNNPAQNQFSATQGASIGVNGTNQYLSLSTAGINKGFWRAGSIAGNDLTGAPLSSMKYTMDVNFSGYTNGSFSFVIGSGFANGVGTSAAAAGQEIFGRLTFRGSASGLWSVTNGVSGTNGTYSGWQTISMFLNDTGSSLNYLAPDGSTQALADGQWDAWVGTVQEVNGVAAEETAAVLSNMKMGLGNTVPGTFNIDNIIINPIPAL